jgi:hypothetical protein
MSRRALSNFIFISPDRKEEAIPPYSVEHNMGIRYMIRVVAKQDGSAFRRGGPRSVFRRQVAACGIMCEAQHARVHARVKNKSTHPQVVAVSGMLCNSFWSPYQGSILETRLPGGP